MRLRIKIKENSIFTICIAAYYAILVLDRVTRTSFLNLSILKWIVRIGTYVILIVVLLELIRKINNVRILLVVEFITGILFLVSYLMGYLETSRLDTYQQIAMIYIPLAIAAYNIIDRQELLKCLYNVAVISTIVLILMVILSYGNWEDTYDMAVGYIMVFTALILLVHFTVYYKPIDIILAVILCFFILSIGSRGPFICILSFIIIEFVLSNQIKISRKMIILAIASIFLIVVILNINNIALFIYQISQRFGFDSRSLRLLLQGVFISHDSGRSEIWGYYLTLVNESPIIGYGIMGNWSYGIYPHNIIIEFILSFGYPIGIILLVVVVVIMVNGIRNSDKYNKAISILFVSYCTMLFVSSSYLMVWQFFVCIAFCLPQKCQLKVRLTQNNKERSEIRAEREPYDI